MTKPKKQDRSNRYYEEHLRKRNPAIYDDYKNGKYASLNEARRAAGTLQPSTRLKDLTRSWKKATIAEQEQFKLFAGLMDNPTPSGVWSTPAVLIDAEGFLLPVVANRVQEIRDRRGIKMGVIMKELGRKALDASLGNAVLRGCRPSKSMLTPLATWLDTNGHV